MAEFLVREDSCLLDLKGGAIARTLTSTQGLIRVIHAARKWVETMKTPPRVLTVNSASNIELEGPIHKKSQWEDESIDFIRKDLRVTI